MDRKITAPFDKKISQELKAGDYVYITGTIYTARDAAHKRMDEALKKGEKLPFDVENNVIYYKVYVDVDDAKGKLLPTMTARTDIIIDTAENVLMVPLNCLNRDGKRTYVSIYDAKTKTSRDVDVKVGLSNDNEVAVTSSELKAGDVVLARKAVAKQTGTNARMPGMR